MDNFERALPDHLVKLLGIRPDFHQPRNDLPGLNELLAFLCASKASCLPSLSSHSRTWPSISWPWQAQSDLATLGPTPWFSRSSTNSFKVRLNRAPPSCHLTQTRFLPPFRQVRSKDRKLRFGMSNPKLESIGSISCRVPPGRSEPECACARKAPSSRASRCPTRWESTGLGSTTSSARPAWTL